MKIVNIVVVTVAVIFFGMLVNGCSSGSFKDDASIGAGEINPTVPQDPVVPAPQNGDGTSSQGGQTLQDGDQASQDGDQISQDGDQASQDGDQVSQDGDQASQDGDQVSQDGDQASQDGDGSGGSDLTDGSVADGDDDQDQDQPQIPDTDGDGILNDMDEDADGDGYLGAVDDCNDLDSATYPGASDSPDYPNYEDNNCDGSDGDVDNVYWVAMDGNDADLGTIDRPFLTLKKAVEVASADPVRKDIYVVRGTYNVRFLITNGASIYGGFGALTPENSRPRDIAANEVKLDKAMIMVNSVAGMPNSVIEGVTMRGMSNSPVLLVTNSSPAIRHNKIMGANGRFVATCVSVVSFTEFQFEGNVQKNNDIHPVFYDNLIKSGNVVNDNGFGMNMAFQAFASSGSTVHPTLISNRIKSGKAAHTSIAVVEYAMRDGFANLTASQNYINAGKAGTNSAGIVLGFDPSFDEGAPLIITRADITENQIFAGSHASSTVGVAVAKSTEGVYLTNNFIYGGRNALVEATGIYAIEAGLRMVNNTINAGSSRQDAIGIDLDVNTRSALINNILLTEGGARKAGIVKESLSASISDLRNNLFADSLVVLYDDEAAFNKLDNIVQVNALSGIPSIGDNIAGGAQLKDVVGQDYHLRATSPAIDAACNMVEVDKDIDDDLRPSGLFRDIGADEFTTEDAHGAIKLPDEWYVEDDNVDEDDFPWMPD